MLRYVDADKYADLIMTTMIGLQVTAVLDRPRTSKKNQLALIDAIVDGCRVRSHTES